MVNLDSAAPRAMPPLGPVPRPAESTSEIVPEHEQHVAWTLGEPPHVPGEPVRTVADQHPDPEAFASQALLGLPLDAVEHRDLEALPGGPAGLGRRLAAGEQRQIEGAEDPTRQLAAGVEAELGELHRHLGV